MLYLIGPGDMTKNRVCAKVTLEQWNDRGFNLNGHNYFLAIINTNNSDHPYVFDVERYMQPDSTPLFSQAIVFENVRATLDENIYVAARMWSSKTMGLPLWQFLQSMFGC